MREGHVEKDFTGWRREGKEDKEEEKQNVKETHKVTLGPGHSETKALDCPEVIHLLITSTTLTWLAGTWTTLPYLRK